MCIFKEHSQDILINFMIISVGVVKDSSNDKVKVYDDIIRIFEYCQKHELPMAVSSKI